MKLNIVFMGTSNFAVPSLLKLIDAGYHVSGVVTQPDRPRGRGQKLMPSPIKELANQFSLPLFQPSSVKEKEAQEHIGNWCPDLIVVAAYGQIIPPSILELPPLGCVNVHASLLPKYRGAAPIQRAIMAGDIQTGITIMLMDEGLDTGDIISQLPIAIGDYMDYGEVERILANQGADLLLDTIPLLKTGSLLPREQDHSLSTYAAMLTREEEKLDWHQDASSLKNQIRALSPQPGAYTMIKGSRVKIFSCRLVNEEGSGLAGQVYAFTEAGFKVQTGQGALEILEVQKEGKKRISCGDFIKGFKMEIGDILGI